MPRRPRNEAAENFEARKIACRARTWKTIFGATQLIAPLQKCPEFWKGCEGAYPALQQSVKLQEALDAFEIVVDALASAATEAVDEAKLERMRNLERAVLDRLPPRLVRRSGLCNLGVKINKKG